MTPSRQSEREELIEDRIAEWHRVPRYSYTGDPELHEFLGWTLDEYAAWVQDPGKLPPEREGAY